MHILRVFLSWILGLNIAKKIIFLRHIFLTKFKISTVLIVLSGFILTIFLLLKSPFSVLYRLLKYIKSEYIHPTKRYFNLKGNFLFYTICIVSESKHKYCYHNNTCGSYKFIISFLLNTVKWAQWLDLYL